MSLSTRTKQRRTALGLTQKALAKKAGITQQSLHQIEDGTTKNPRKIVQIARAMSCQPEWLLFGENADTVQAPNTSLGPDIKGHYPLIGWVQAGNWKDIGELDESDIEYYPCPVKCSNDTFVLRVHGISMEPVFKEGNLIFVDPEVAWQHNSYVVVRSDEENEATLKQLIVEADKYFLKPANPSWPEQIISLKKSSTIVGVVVFAGQTF